MGSFIPAGRLGAIDHGGQRIEIQTEFSKYPEPRIATSVSISGTVIHKIQKLWGKNVDSIEEMREVEEVINKQHNEITELVQEHGSSLIARSKAKAATPSFTDIVIEVGNLPQVQSAFFLTADGKIHAKNEVTSEAKLIASMIGNLCEVLFDIALATNLGDCEDCVLQLGTEDALFIPCHGGYLVVMIDPKVRKREVLAAIHKIAEAA